MLVQLSPWQTCSTSVPVSTKRRRKRSDASSPEEERPLPVEASFVTSVKRKREKKKSKSFGMKEEPTIAITASHRISIVGRGAASTLQESSPWQFRSHPGRTTAFLQQDQTGSMNGKSIKKIPAILDARNDHMYALQSENGTLACWNANDSSGPDDVDVPAIKVQLTSAAVSLSTLAFQKGVAYGTCANGSFYVARWNEERTLSVDYSDGVQTIKGAQHVFTTTVQAASSSNNDVAQVGQKRKASHDQGDFLFYQVFSKGNGVYIYKRHVNLTEKECLNGTNTQVSFVDLTNGTSGMRITSISASQVDNSTIAIVFAAERGDNGSSKSEQHKRYYCAPMELETGQLTRSPFALAKFTRHAAAVTPSLLAVGTLDEILLYDIKHGAIVHRTFVSNVVGDCKNWSLITEARRGRLAILSIQNGYAHVSFARALLDDISYQQAESTQGSGYSLAVGLRSSLASTAMIEEPSSASSQQRNLLDLISVDADTVNSEQYVDECVTKALVRLRACVDEIQDADNTEIQPFFFMNEYERSVISILAAASSPLSSSPSPSPRPKKQNTLKKQKKSPLSNGVHHAEASDSTQDTEDTSTVSKHDEVNGSTSTQTHLVNGLKVPNKIRGYTPSHLPQRFVDDATSIVLSVLQLPQTANKAVGIRSKLARLDARLILSRLIRTGKVSARLHFDPTVDRGQGLGDDDEMGDYFFDVLRSLKLTKKGGNRVFSPVDLMHEMITWCPDISEVQMITMIHYMMCKALAEDIAENILDEGNLQAGHPYRILAKRSIQVRSALRKHRAATKVSEKDISKLSEQEETLSLKLVRAGTKILVSRLVRYSRCNETLLRNAMAEGLTGRQEPTILARVLVDLLNGQGAMTPATTQSFVPSTALLSKWIFTLCEACQDRLVTVDGSTKSEGESPLSDILASVKASLKSTEGVMSLHNTVYQFVTSKSEQKEEESIEVNKLALSASRNREAAPAPYSIERLAF